MRAFTLTLNTSAKLAKWNRKAAALTLDQLNDIISTPEIREKKDGACFVPGVLLGESRKAAAVESIDLLVYDIDGSQTVEEVAGIIQKLGVTAWLYTTFSHLTSRTLVKTDLYDRWATKHNGSPKPKLEDMRRYLDAAKKTHLKNISFDISTPELYEKHFTQNEEGMHFVVFHDPLEKMRVVFPLRESVILRNFSHSTKKAIEGWKEVYHGVGRAIGLQYDSSCEDPSRLYYIPAVTPGGQDKYDAYLFGDLSNPVLLDVNDYPRAVLDNSVTRSNTKPFLESTLTDADGVTIQLDLWNNNNQDFDIEGCLESTLPPDMIKAPRASGSGFHITCPFEAEHSTTGGLGTFCANEDGQRPWEIHCSHNGCSGRSKLDFLGEYIKQGYVKAEDLGIEAVKASPPDDLSGEAVGNLLGLDISTLPSNFSRLGDAVAVGDYVITETEGDDKLTPEEVYEACLKDIIESKSAVTATAAIGRMISKKCEIDNDDICEVLAKSEVSGEGIHAILTKFARNVGFEYGSAKTRISEIRLSRYPIEDRMNELYEARPTGHELDIEKRRIADFYLLERKAVSESYNRRELQLVKERHGKMFAEKFPQLTAQWAKLRHGNRMVFLDMQASIRKGDAVTQRPSDLENWMRNENKSDIITSGKTTREVRTFLYKAWVEECTEIHEFYGITFLPGGPRVTPENKFNLWSGDFFVQRQKGDCSIITNHIKDVWCSGDVETYNWVVTWLASIFQRPEYKPPTSLALLGAQGTGKSIIFEYGLARILGPYFGTSADRDDLVGRFSGHLVGKLLWVAEESLFAGDKRAMNKLKSRISSNTVDVEYKGLDKFSIPSFTRFVFTSNQIHALNLESDDRRFCVLPTSSMYAQNLEYFTKMREWLDNGGVSILYDFLMSWKPEDVGLTWNSLMHPPYNEAKRQQAEMSLEPADNYFLDIIKYGRVMEAPSNIFAEGPISWPLNEPINIKTGQLRSGFEAYLRHHMGSVARFERNKYGALSARYLGKGANVTDLSKVIRVDGQLIRVVTFPPRKEFMEEAISRRHITKSDLDHAIENPDSHLYNEPKSDVL